MRRLLCVALLAALILPATAQAAPHTTKLVLTPEVEAINAAWGVSETTNVVGFRVSDRAVGVTKWTVIKPDLPPSAREYMITGLAPVPTEVKVQTRYEEAGVVKGSAAAKGTATPLVPEGNTVGHSLYELDAASYFDQYAGEEGWIQAHVSEFLAYPSFGNVYIKYGKPVLAYNDIATEGFAPLTPEKRATYVAKVEAHQTTGYAGAFMDDINWSVGYRDGSESKTLEPEQKEMAELVCQIHAAEPTALIQLNSQYHDIWPLMKAGNANVAKALGCAGSVWKEFGVGPSAGIGTATDFREFTEYVAALHSKGLHFTMGGDHNNQTVAVQEYSLAAYFLASDGSDYVSGVNQVPGNFWKGYESNLGASTSSAEHSGAVWKRSFSEGVVYTVDPGAAEQTITLPKATMTNGSGNSVTSPVKLAASHGLVLHN